MSGILELFGFILLALLLLPFLVVVGVLFFLRKRLSTLRDIESPEQLIEKLKKAQEEKESTKKNSVEEKPIDAEDAEFEEI